MQSDLMVLSGLSADLETERPAVEAGPDAATMTPSSRRTLLIAAGAFFLTWLAFSALALAGPNRLDAGPLDGVHDLLTACASMAAVALGTLVIVQRRVIPTSVRTFGIGLALVVEGAIVLDVEQLYPLTLPASQAPLAALASPAAIILVIALFGWSAVARPTPSPGWSVSKWMLAAGSLGALISLLHFLPSLAQALSITIPASHSSGWTTGQLFLAASWSTIAALALLHRSDGSLGPRDVAIGVVALGLAQSRLVLIMAHGEAARWVLASHVFQLMGFAIGFGVVAREFNRRVRSREEQLMDSLLNVRTHAARRQARQAVEAVRRHDTHSALFAVSGAAQLLADRYGELSDAQRAALTGILTDGVGQLSGLAKVRTDEVEALDIDLVVRSVVEAERASGIAITAAVPAGLRGVGCAADLAVVLQILARLGQGHPIVVRGSQERGFVVLSVEASDDSSAAPAVRSLQDSLDLEVASRLMVEHGGAISIGNAEGQGISFGVRLPAEPVGDR